jgi:Trp operon repressor
VNLQDDQIIAIIKIFVEKNDKKKILKIRLTGDEKDNLDLSNIIENSNIN